MNVDLMRRVDFWLGVPICFMLSLLDKLVPRRHKAIGKIAFLQISEMGSTIHAYSSIRYVQKKFPKAKVYYVIFDEMRASIELLDVLPKKNIITLRGHSVWTVVLDTFKVIYRLRALRVDVAVDMELFSRYSAILSYMSGAGQRIGFDRFAMEGLYKGSLQTHRIIYNHTLPISLNFLTLAHAVGVRSRLPAVKKELNLDMVTVPKVRSNSESKKRMWTKLRRLAPDLTEKHRLVVLNPNASGLLPLRRWPLERYIELGKRLVQHKDVYLVVAGVESEKEDTAAVCAGIGRRCIDLAGETTLGELIDLYNVSSLMVSNDSGPPNFASLTGMPTYVLFGPESPLLYKPLGQNVHAVHADFTCSPCVSAYTHRKSLCTDNKCLQAISVDRVYRLVEKTLLK
jgi:ADP-heptose:LPS heptosyltransferase